MLCENLRKINLKSRNMYCRNCGTAVHQNAVACPKCGVPPLLEKKFCQECGMETKENQLICIKCGVKLINKGSIGGNLNLNIDTSNLNIQSLICVCVMFVFLWFPWLGRFSNYWINGLQSMNSLTGRTHISIFGVFMLLFTLGGVGLSFRKFKYTLLIGIINFIFALLYYGDYFKYWKEWSFGGYVFMVGAIAFTIVNIKTFKRI